MQTETGGEARRRRQPPVEPGHAAAQPRRLTVPPPPVPAAPAGSGGRLASTSPTHAATAAAVSPAVSPATSSGRDGSTGTASPACIDSAVLGHQRDALDGTPGAIQVRLALRERAWVIRLAPHNPRALEEALTPFTAAADRITRARWDALTPADAAGPVVAARVSSAPVRFDAPAIRAWAAEQGMNVPERGKVPARIKVAYRQAMSGAAATPAAPDTGSPGPSAPDCHS